MKMGAMPLKLEINARSIPAEKGRSLFDHAESVGIHVPTSCRKQGKCRECLVEVTAGMDLLNPRCREEEHLSGAFRLSCRAHPVETNGTVRCHTLRRAAMRIDEGMTQPRRRFPLEPAVVRRADTVLLDGREIGTSNKPLYGLAVDLGTTTVVMRLVNLETGEITAAQSFENPQRFAGSDVMARICFDTEHPGRLQQRTLLGYMSRAIESFPCSSDTIYEMVVAGNATMRDLFFGLDVRSIGQRPYRSLTEHELLAGKRQTTSLVAAARRLRLPLHAEARIYGLPLVGCHVGADAAACLLAIDLMNERRTVALMDIGTNSELIVGHRDRALAASCPAGPAFEGGSIACGMPGLDGAIEGVKLALGDAPHLKIIGDGRAAGICGSGLVELLSELLRTEQMTELGRLGHGVPRFDLDNSGKIFLEERDISELAQAKGANVAGLRIVTKNYGIDFDEIDTFYLAGGFGRHLSVDAARRIGLIPDLPDDRIVQLGNASIEGATYALLSVPQRMQLEDFVCRIGHVELETDSDFFDHFVEGCQFQRLQSVAKE